MENIAARLHYMEEAKEDVRADIAVMKRAAEKADSEVTKAELEKKKQVQYTVIKETNNQRNKRHKVVTFVWNWTLFVQKKNCFGSRLNFILRVLKKPGRFCCYNSIAFSC